MMHPSSLLISLALLTSTAFADDGQYHPDQYAGATVAVATTAVAATAVAASVETAATHGFGTVTAQPYATTSAQAATGKATGVVVSQVASASENDATATGDWESQVTWPAGCETWANPCPSGAHISGGGVAGYTNGFTSFLTETDSNGVITGMPTKATIAAGAETISASASASTLLTTTSSSRNSSSTSSRPSSTQNGFSAGSSSASLSNGAGSTAISSGLMLFAIGALATFLA